MQGHVPPSQPAQETQSIAVFSCFGILLVVQRKGKGNWGKVTKAIPCLMCGIGEKNEVAPETKESWSVVF